MFNVSSLFSLFDLFRVPSAATGGTPGAGMLYESGDGMLFENGDRMIFED